MRKAVLEVLALALVAALAPTSASAPASAGDRRRTVTDSWTAQVPPYPDFRVSGTTMVKEECVYGAYLTGARRTLDAPGDGLLRAWMEGFTGDWDLFVVHPNNQVIVGSIQNQITQGAPAREEVLLFLQKGNVVQIAPCNWLGHIQAEVHYEFTYTVPRARRSRSPR